MERRSEERGGARERTGARKRGEGGGKGRRGGRAVIKYMVSMKCAVYINVFKNRGPNEIPFNQFCYF